MKRGFYLLAAAWIPWGGLTSVDLQGLKDGQVLRAQFATTCERSDKDVSRVLNLSVARTEKYQQKGLSKRSQPLGDHEGMIFVFTPPRQGQIWMKDTWVPLQLVHVHPSGGVVAVQEMPVETDPTKPSKIYTAQPAVSAVVELKPGRIPSPGYDLKLCILRDQSPQKR